MPDTHGFEVVAEVGVEILREFLESAWDNGGTDEEGVIPHEVSIPGGLMFGSYRVDHGQVQIPREGLSLDMAAAENGVTVTLGTRIEVAMDPSTIPVPSLSLFAMTADISVSAPFGVIPGTSINVGVIFDGLPRNRVSVTLDSGDPIGPITQEMISEYVHKLYEDGVIPHTQSFEDQNWLALSFDAFIEFFDDPSDTSRQITVQHPDPGHVEISVPIHVRLSNISDSLPLLSPMGVTARLVITAPFDLDSASGKVTASLTAATIAVKDMQPASGIEGTNYSVNSAGAALLNINLEDLFNIEIERRGKDLLNALGDMEIDVPTVRQIERFVGDQVHQELLQRRYMAAWTPESPEGSPVEIREVRPKALSDALAIGINPGPGADENLLANFIPAGQAFGIALDADFVVQTIREIIDRPKSEGGFGGIPQHFDNIEGHDVDVTELHWELRSGAIHFWGECTVHDVFCKADADVSFWADIGLKWSPPDTSGRQVLVPDIIDKDADLPWWAWLIAVLTFLFGVILGVIAIVITIVVENLVERVGGSVMEDEVSGQLQTLGAWPQQLQGIGTVTSAFQEDVGIDSSGLLFSGSMLVTARYALTSVSPAQAGGPYVGLAGSPINFHAGIASTMVFYHWDFGDGKTATGNHVTHTYSDDGLYVVRLTSTVNEPGGAITHHSVLVRVLNVQPVVNAGSDMIVDEGKEAHFSGSFTDQEWPDTHEAIWDFGDDSLPIRGVVTETNNPPRSEGVVTGSHAYCDSGEYIVTLRVRDDDGGIGEDSLNVTVRNVPPSVEAGDMLFAYRCTPINLVGLFTDPGWCDTHTAVWEFGDCTPPIPAVVREVNQPPIGYGFAVATHTYQTCGTYLAECTVIDDDGGEGRDNVTVRVIDVLNRDFESGFRNLVVGTVANHWEPYQMLGGTDAGAATMRPPTAGGAILFYAEEFVVHDGQRSQRIEGTGEFRAGIYQQVGANPNWDYQISTWYHLDERLSGTCRLGVDPNGGIDSNSAEIQWSEGNEQHNWAQLVVRVTAQARAITIFLEAVSKARGSRGYFDDVALLPFPCPLEEPEKPEEEVPKQRERCVDWKEEKTQREMGVVYEKDGFTFQTMSQEPLRIVLWGSPQGQGKLIIPRSGVRVKLPFAADRVVSHVTLYHKESVKMEAMDVDGNQIDQATSTLEQGITQTLEIKASGITTVFFVGGGGEGLLIDLCAYREAGTEGKRTPKKQRDRRGC